ncbi:hypothetical protein GCM10023205_49730 [Yinghuangia aomiensis]|uniref:Uncharacterized protein n=1 Tax=Yinghuangia aomiensis TaxID=676205 RepID=A0ABP9HRB2_9ACTN
MKNEKSEKNEKVGKKAARAAKAAGVDRVGRTRRPGGVAATGPGTGEDSAVLPRPPVRESVAVDSRSVGRGSAVRGSGVRPGPVYEPDPPPRSSPPTSFADYLAAAWWPRRGEPAGALPGSVPTPEVVPGPLPGSLPGSVLVPIPVPPVYPPPYDRPPMLVPKGVLRQRGWTESGIRQFLDGPDALAPNPVVRTAPAMRLYALDRALAAESTPAWQVWRAESAARRASLRARLRTGEE